MATSIGGQADPETKQNCIQRGFFAGINYTQPIIVIWFESQQSHDDFYEARQDEIDADPTAHANYEIIGFHPGQFPADPKDGVSPATGAAGEAYIGTTVFNEETMTSRTTYNPEFGGRSFSAHDFNPDPSAENWGAPGTVEAVGQLYACPGLFPRCSNCDIPAGRSAQLVLEVIPGYNSGGGPQEALVPVSFQRSVGPDPGDPEDPGDSEIIPLPPCPADAASIRTAPPAIIGGTEDFLFADTRTPKRSALQKAFNCKGCQRRRAFIKSTVSQLFQR